MDEFWKAFRAGESAEASQDVDAKSLSRVLRASKVSLRWVGFIRNFALWISDLNDVEKKAWIPPNGFEMILRFV